MFVTNPSPPPSSKTLQLPVLSNPHPLYSIFEFGLIRNHKPVTC